MKTVNKIICITIVFVVIVAQFPIMAFAKTVTNVPSFNAEQSDVVSEDGLWTYDIARDRNGELRVWITDYHETVGSELIIPSTIDGMRVQSVDMWATLRINKGTKIKLEENVERIGGNFLQAKQNLQVELPSSLLMIDPNTFMVDTNLTINFPDGLTAIGEGAFSKCTFSGTTDIVLPESLKCIGNNAFEKTNITSVKMGSKTDFAPSYFSQTVGAYPTSITFPHTFPYTPFVNCTSLTSLKIDENNPYFINENGVIYTADKKELVFMNSAPLNYVIPDSVEYICSRALENKTFESVFISSSIVNLGGLSFSGSTIGKVIFADDCTIDIISNTFKNCKIDEITIPKSVTRIDSDAFYKCGIKKLNFEEGSELSEIGMRAFASNDFDTLDLTNCKLLTTAFQNAFNSNERLKTVDMTGVPMEELSRSMFGGCSNLREFKISKYSRIIAYSAFYGDKELEDIDLSHIAKIEESSFQLCDKINVSNFFVSSGTTEDGYQYNEFENHISLIGYTGDTNELVMPDEINGKPVTDIVWSANMIFRNKRINSVKLPEKLEFISSYAFQYTQIKELSELPETLRYIGGWAFSGCSFNEVTLNEGLEYVLSAAFEWCPFESLEIPDSVLYYCGGMNYTENSITFGKNVRNIKKIIDVSDASYRAANIYISPENPYYCFENGILYNGDKTEIYRAFNSYNVDEISENYQIPESVKIIDDNAFNGCTALKGLTLPASVEYIGKGAFRDCTALGDMIVSEKTEYIGKEAFSLSSLTSVHFSDGFKTETLQSTFTHCDNLHSVTFGDVDVKNLIGTFVGSGIKNVDIPESVVNLTGTYFFTDLSNITEVKLPDGLKVLSGTFESSNISISEIVIPKGVEKIGGYTFHNCKKLKRIDFGNVKFLGKAAFMNCTALETVDLTGITYFAEDNEGTFSDCPKLKKLTFNRTDKGTDIEENANENNDSIETVVIGNGIKNVKSKAFADCSNLETAVISDSVESIADNAFENCKKLTIVCTKNSNAMLYAKQNNINYKTFKINPVPDQEYTGKEIKPGLNVTVGESRLSAGKDYSVSYSDNINIGTAKAFAVGLGDYSIYASTVKFNIVPHQHKYSVKTVKPSYEKEGYTLHSCSCGKSYKTDKKAKLKVNGATIKKLSAGRKEITVSFKKVKNISGYQLQYSTSKSFKTIKTVSVSNPKTVKKKIKNLKAKKKYYIRIRAYKKVGKKTYYSSWSKAKSVKTK